MAFHYFSHALNFSIFFISFSNSQCVDMPNDIGFFQCSSDNDCLNNGTCNLITMLCECAPTFVGRDCGRERCSQSEALRNCNIFGGHRDYLCDKEGAQRMHSTAVFGIVGTCVGFGTSVFICIIFCVVVAFATDKKVGATITCCCGSCCLILTTTLLEAGVVALIVLAIMKAVHKGRIESGKIHDYYGYCMVIDKDTYSEENEIFDFIFGLVANYIRAYTG